MARTRTGPTPAELTLMGLLAEGPAHPYSLDLKLKEHGSWTEVAFSSIYAALDRLEKLGLVVSRPDAGERGKARRVYRLTPAGRALLKTQARDALAKPMEGARPNELGITNLMMLSRHDVLLAIGEARRILFEERKHRPSPDEPYPQVAISLHRALIAAAEERFYSELEKLVLRQHPERIRRRGDEDLEADF
jgi:PadR family transcriptional regulator PadR